MKWLFLLVVFAFIGCSICGQTAQNAPPEAPPDVDYSGKFVVENFDYNGTAPISGTKLSLQKYGAKFGQVAYGNITDTFVLGDIKNSQTFYFILENGGSNAITNITLSSPNPNFNISPTYIPYLSFSGSSGVVPVIELQITHGESLNGIGLASLLPMGTNTCDIIINGSTKTGPNAMSPTTNITLNLIAEVNALIADAQLWQYGQQTNEYYWDELDPTQAPITITNVGNCLLTVYDVTNVTGIIFTNIAGTNIGWTPTAITDIYNLLPGQSYTYPFNPSYITINTYNVIANWNDDGLSQSQLNGWIISF